MKTSSFKKHLWIPAVVGVTAILGAASAEAALTPVPAGTAEFPGILLGAGGTALGGTVLATRETPLAGTLPLANPFTGFVRSMVVDPGAAGGPLDFYYQVINTSTGDASPGFDNDIYRTIFGGYPQGAPSTLTASADYMNDGVTTISALSGVPLSFTSTFLPTLGNTVYSVDTDPFVPTPEFNGGVIGFDFDSTQLFDTNPGPGTSAPNNINEGEASNWLVVRTNYDFYSYSLAQLTGTGGTMQGTILAPIPEPSTVLFGLAMFGICAGGRMRKPRGAQ